MNRINPAHAKAGGRRRGLTGRGFTLVEVLVAMLVGLFLIGGMLQLFVGSKQTYRVVDSLSRIQENTRFALERIARDLRLAGHAGCVRLNNLGTEPAVWASTGAVFSNSAFMEGVATLAAASTDWPSTTQLGTDAVRLRLLSPEYERVTLDMASTSDAITLQANNANFAAGETLAIADCSNVDVFTAGTVAGSPPTITLPAQLSKAYLTDSDVMRFHTIVYYVAPADTGPSLALRRNEDGNDEELIVGVEDMEILYQVVGNSNYVDAASVTDWGQILGVRINVLLVSEQSNLTPAGEPQTLEWRGNTSYPSTTDARIRQIATTTIALRNRLL